MEQATPTYCVNCGARLAPGARFCHVCGATVHPLQTAPTAIVPPPVAPQQTWPDWQASGQPAVTTNYATFGERFVALIIDWIILSVVGWIVGLILGIVGYLMAGPSDGTDVVVGGTVMAFMLVVYWLYFAVQESSPHQATFGKRAMKIIVTDEQGRRLSFGRAAGRTLGKILSGVIFYLGYVLAAFTARKQALHDLIAETVVLKR